MAKKNQAEEPKIRYSIVLMDSETGVQVAAGTHDLDKFTKTDIMKMVSHFKKGIKAEEKHIADNIKKAEKELNGSNKRGNSNVSKGVRGSRKVRRPKA